MNAIKKQPCQLLAGLLFCCQFVKEMCSLSNRSYVNACPSPTAAGGQTGCRRGHFGSTSAGCNACGGRTDLHVNQLIAKLLFSTNSASCSPFNLWTLLSYHRFTAEFLTAFTINETPANSSRSTGNSNRIYCPFCGHARAIFRLVHGLMKGVETR